MIHKDIQIEDLVERYPDTIKLLSELGIKCIVCGEPIWGTLEENARLKGLNNIDEIVIQLNERINLKNEENSEII